MRHAPDEWTDGSGVISAIRGQVFSCFIAMDWIDSCWIYQEVTETWVWYSSRGGAACMQDSN